MARRVVTRLLRDAVDDAHYNAGEIPGATLAVRTGRGSRSDEQRLGALPCRWRQLTGERSAYEVCIQDHECYGIRLRDATSTAGGES